MAAAASGSRSYRICDSGLTPSESSRPLAEARSEVSGSAESFGFCIGRSLAPDAPTLPSPAPVGRTRTQETYRPTAPDQTTIVRLIYDCTLTPLTLRSDPAAPGLEAAPFQVVPASSGAASVGRVTNTRP